MKTIQMTIDDRLLKLVDKMSRAQKTSRSAFIRIALEAEIRRQRVSEEEARHLDGYARKPVKPGEFDVWNTEQDWVEAFLRMPSAGNAYTGFFVDGHFAAGCRIAHPAVGVVIVSRDAHGGLIPQGNINGAVDSAAAMLHFRGAENFPG